MRKTLSFIPILITLTLGAAPARAQSPPLDFNGVQTSIVATNSTLNGSINFYTPASLSTQQNGRQTCFIEYTGLEQAAVPNTPQSFGYVFFGPTAPTVTNTSFVLQPYQFLYCETEAGGVDNNKVWVASTVTSGIFVFKVK